MKKVSLIIVGLLFNFTLHSCTEESIEEIIHNQKEIYATEGEEEKVDPEEEPPGKN